MSAAPVENVQAAESSKELEALIERGKVALRKEGVTLALVADAILPQEVVPSPVAKVVQSRLPKPLTLDDKAKEAQARLKDVFGKVTPTERRLLVEDEIVALAEEDSVLVDAMSPIKKRREAIKEFVRLHIDVDAEVKNEVVPNEVQVKGQVFAATPRDDDGHYLGLAKPGEPRLVPIPGTNKDFSLEHRDGGLEVDTDEALAMYERGELSREDYLSITRAVRVFDSNRFLEAARNKPELLLVLQKISRRKSPHTQLFIRERK